MDRTAMTTKVHADLVMKAVAHDIRSPLQVIVSAAERLEKPGADLKKIENQILKSAQAILDIVDRARAQILKVDH